MYVLVYDIVNDRRRTRLHNYLKNFGTAVQRSVFEFDLGTKEVDKMMLQVQELIDAEEDTVRLYSVCEECIRRARILGKGRLSLDPDFYIV